MFDAHRTEDPEIERYDVSEDGVMWRPFDATRDQGRTLHRRIKFAVVDDEQDVRFAKPQLGIGLPSRSCARG